MPVTFPQVKSTLLCVLAIALVSFSFSMMQGLRHGEFHSIAQWAEILWDSLSYAGTATFGWIALKSPLAKVVLSLFEQEKIKTSETPEGGKTVEKTTTSVQVQAPDQPKEAK